MEEIKKFVGRRQPEEIVEAKIVDVTTQTAKMFELETKEVVSVDEVLLRIYNKILRY